jgi:hypothetical protein
MAVEKTEQVVLDAGTFEAMSAKARRYETIL